MSLIIVFCIAFSVCWLLKGWFHLYLTSYKIHGPWSLPLIGSIFTIFQVQPDKLAETLLRYRKYYGATFRIWLGPKLWVFLHTPQEMKDLLTNVSLKKSNAFYLMSPIFGNSVLMCIGKEWQQHRRLMETGFRMNFNRRSQQKILYHSDVFVQNLPKSENEAMEITESLFNCVLDMIVDIFIGSNLEIQYGKNLHFLHAIHRLNELFFQRMINPIFFHDVIYKWTSSFRATTTFLNIVYSMMDNLIEKRKEYLCSHGEKSSQTKSHILLDILLNASMEGKVTLKEIREEINTLLFAGVDTTSIALSYALYALAKYPQEQIKVYEEIQQIKQTTTVTDNTEDNYLKDLSKYKYLDLFLKESLRMYTTVPCTGRQISTPTKIGSHVYESGVDIWINFYGICHDPNYFQDPHIFRPERFLNESEKASQDFCFLPFSSSPRICIGRKTALAIMKIVIIKVLQRFYLSLDDNYEELLFKVELVLKPRNGLCVRFKEKLNS